MLSAQKFMKKIMKICGNEKTVHLEMCTKINFAKRRERFYTFYWSDLLNYSCPAGLLEFCLTKNTKAKTDTT